jgi:acetyl-CoA carboxylase carboxyltransferase component
MYGREKPMSMREKIEEVRQRREMALGGGREEKHQQGKNAGKYSARERIDKLLDKNTFTELFMFAEHQCYEFGMEKKKVPGDGVITGHGLVGGRRVFVYAHDAIVFGGSVGAAGGGKSLR